MRTKYIADKKEIEAIKEVIAKIMNLYQYDVICARNTGTEAEISMSKETFFSNLERELS